MVSAAPPAIVAVIIVIIAVVVIEVRIAPDEKAMPVMTSVSMMETAAANAVGAR